MTNDSLYKAILESLEPSTRTVDGAFKELLEREINISPSVRAQASKSHLHLRDFLSGKNRNDLTFPRVLSQVDRDFLGGSFDRHTKVKPLDDIDIYVPLDGYSLLYLQNGTRLPYTVMSDGAIAINPILTARWTNGAYVSSRKLINGFAAVLKDFYHETSVRPNGQAVTIRMSELGYDVVPCFLLRPDAQDAQSFYLIPDGNDGWLRTNPKIDADLTDRLNQNNGGLYRKVVKLIKHWNSTALSNRLASYYIELAIMTTVFRENAAGRSITGLSEGVAFAFSAVSKAFAAGNQTPWLLGAPPVTAGKIGALDGFSIGLAATQAQTALNHERAGRIDAAIQEWQGIFDKFGQ